MNYLSDFFLGIQGDLSMYESERFNNYFQSLNAGEKCQVMYPIFYIFDNGEGRDKQMINFVITTPSMAKSITINNKRR